MGRAPCCEKVGLNRGPWTRDEDLKLTEYITKHGEGSWRTLPKSAGLLRCGKSCRLRWINYLHPDLKRGNISEEEDQLIITLHTLLGNRWSLIAGRLPGRTDNEIKNYWNTNLKKRLRTMGIDPDTHRPLSQKQQQQALQADDKNGANGQGIINPMQLPQQLLHRSTANASSGLKSKSLNSSLNHASLNGATAAAPRDENYQTSAALVDSFLRDSVMYPDHSDVMHLPQLEERHCAAADPLPASRSFSSSFSMHKSVTGSLSFLGAPCSPISTLQQCCSFGCADKECFHMIADFCNSCSYSDLELELSGQKEQPLGLLGESPSITSESTASSRFLLDKGMSTPSSYESGLTSNTGWEAHFQLPEVNGRESIQQLSSLLLKDIGDTDHKQNSSYQFEESITADHSSSTNSAHDLTIMSNCSSVGDVSIWDMEILQPLGNEQGIAVMDPTSISVNDTIGNRANTSGSNLWDPKYPQNVLSFPHSGQSKS